MQEDPETAESPPKKSKKHKKHKKHKKDKKHKEHKDHHKKQKKKHHSHQRQHSEESSTQSSSTVIIDTFKQTYAIGTPFVYEKPKPAKNKKHRRSVSPPLCQFSIQREYSELYKEIKQRNRQWDTQRLQ